MYTYHHKRDMLEGILALILKNKKIKVIQHDELNLFDEIDIFIHSGASTPPKSIFKLFYSNVLRNIYLLNILKKKIKKFFFYLQLVFMEI